MEAVLEKESFIKSELKKYNVTDASIAELSEQSMKLKVKNVNDQNGYTIVRKARIGVKNKRCEVESKRKELKAESVSFGKKVDAEAKRITGLLAPIEEHLISQEKIVDDEKARIIAEKDRLEKERIEKEEAERKRAEEEKQAKIREEQKIEYERLEKIRIEMGKRDAELKAEKESLEKEQKEEELKIREAQEQIEVEKRAIIAQKEKEAQEKQGLIEVEKAKSEAIEKARIEAEQKAKREVEAERIAKEREKADEQLRLAMLPDKEKLSALAKAIEAIPMPALSHGQSHGILKEAKDYLVKACIVLRKKNK